jgi:hypothetical protein
MKFEFVEPAELPTSDELAAPPSPPPPAGGPNASIDSAAGLAVVTERLTTEVAAAVERIDVSMGELIAAVAAPSAQESNSARPPGNFRPERFGAARDTRRHHP